MTLKDYVLENETYEDGLKRFVRECISELKAENKRLREALQEIADGKYEHYLATNPPQNAATVFAEAALENNDA